MSKLADVTTLEEIKDIIAKVVAEKNEKGGVKNVYCLACGGSYASFYPMEYF